MMSKLKNIIIVFSLLGLTNSVTAASCHKQSHVCKLQYKNSSNLITKMVPCKKFPYFYCPKSVV